MRLEANALIERSRGQREEQLVNHHVGGATNREAWKKLPTNVPEVGHYVVYKNEVEADSAMCVEGGVEHPWLVGLVLSIETNNTFKVHETGRPIPTVRDLFSIKNAYYLRFQVTKTDSNNEEVTQDFYKTKRSTPSGATRVESVISFDALAWWNTEEKVLTKTRRVLHEVLKELSAMKQIKWQWELSAKRKSKGVYVLLLISNFFFVFMFEFLILQNIET